MPYAIDLSGKVAVVTGGSGVLGMALSLVSDAARFVTGVVVPVDGGFSAYAGV